MSSSHSHGGLVFGNWCSAGIGIQAARKQGHELLEYSTAGILKPETSYSRSFPMSIQQYGDSQSFEEYGL